MLYVNTAAFLFNVGVNSFILLYLATYNRKRIDLSRGAMMNWQGVGAAQFLFTVPTLVLPLLIYLPFGLAGMPYVGIAVLGAVGAVGLLLHQDVIALLVKRFQQQKHRIAAGFRMG